MTLLRKFLKWFVYLLAIPVVYLVVAFILSSITINESELPSEGENAIYLNTNGVHLDIVIPKKDLSSEFLKGIIHSENEHYIAFGWGDENFYLNTPTWNDLTFGNAFGAMFLRSSTLMHLTRYKQKRSSWVEVTLNQSELKHLTQYISKSFKEDDDGRKVILPGAGYSTKDNFYKANGNYSCFKTCNTWVNTAFKESGLKACFWTPFDFSLINKYK